MNLALLCSRFLQLQLSQQLHTPNLSARFIRLVSHTSSSYITESLRAHCSACAHLVVLPHFFLLTSSDLLAPSCKDARENKIGQASCCHSGGGGIVLCLRLVSVSRRPHGLLDSKDTRYFASLHLSPLGTCPPQPASKIRSHISLSSRISTGLPVTFDHCCCHVPFLFVATIPLSAISLCALHVRWATL